MLESAAAIWLDTNLAGFDHFFLSIQHFFADKAGVVLTPFFRFITFMGEKGWPFFLLAFLFLLFANTRDLGVCIFGAVCCGALITNVILKDNVARLRPFENSIEYELWWMAVGSPAEEGFSFPSGHVTACAAGMTAIIMMRGKKWILPSIVIVLLMAISRNYLMAHYPSDVIAAILIGVFSGIVSWFITQLIFRFLNRNRAKIPFFGWILDFDIRDVLPFLPRREKKAAPAPAPKKTPAAGDDDVKTYSSRRQRVTADALATPVGGEFKPAPARPVPADVMADIEAPARLSRPAAPAEPVKPARPASAKAASAKAAPASSGGRHALPEGARSSRPKASGTYQGKH